MSIKIKLFTLTFVMLSFLNVTAQKDRVLFSVDGENVYSSEFSRVYEKNLSLVTDPAQKDLDNYLELYINYKLKLKEAYDLKMDTVPSYIKEYNKYKGQLLEPYLKDADTEKDLIQEAYDRMKQEVNASHILIKVSKSASPEDTLKAYNKLNDIRNRILNGASFEEEAKANSEDPSAKQNGGNLGFFTVFQMVYPFENAAYTTKMGEVSPVFKTKFGYHIVKVIEKRPSRGEVEVAHIMLSGNVDTNKPQIEKLKKELDGGADFSDLAKRYSQDQGSAKKGGLLAKFGAGRMVKAFEKVAFSLEHEGDISEPFKTRYGWHIIKLIKKYPVPMFDKVEALIKKRVIQGQRAKILGKSVVNRLAKEYTIVEHRDLIRGSTNQGLLSDTTILTIEGKDVDVSEFKSFMNYHKRTPPEKAFELFKEEQILEYYKTQLPRLFPEVKQTLQEYEEGLLLFDLMQTKIWDKAEKDSVGLAHYFEKHQKEYQWKERADAIIVTCDKMENAVVAQNMFETDTVESIKKQLANTGLVDIKEGAFEKDNSVFPEGLEFKKGVSKIFTVDNHFVVTKIKDLLPAGPKTLQETRGKVISKYQDHIEAEWLKSLRNRYSVVVNKKTLKKLKKHYN